MKFHHCFFKSIKLKVFLTRTAVMKDPFNRDILRSIFCKYKTLIAESQVFTSVPWREHAPTAQYSKRENNLFLKKTEINK